MIADLPQSIIDGFVTEADDLCEQVTQELPKLVQSTVAGETRAASRAVVSRALHTLKGSAATLGFDDLADIARELEHLVRAVSDPTALMPSEHETALGSALAEFQGRLRCHAKGESASLPDVGSVIAQLRKLTGESAPLAAAPAPANAPAPELPTSEANASHWQITADQVRGLMREAERLRELHLRLIDRERTLAQVTSQMQRLALFEETAEPRAILLAQTRALSGDTDEVAELVRSLEAQIKAIGAAPLSSILDPLHAEVRALCQGNGKEAALSVVGADLVIDRRVLEALRDPLVQLIRNAMLHGIEVPKKRIGRGKHREGALVIRVEQQGNVLLLEVSDDGNGLDFERIREIAVERGILSSSEVRAVSEDSLAQVIFRSGFSTRLSVNETSGRGIGLDVVRAEMQALRGNAEVVSIPGQGTRFLLNLPIELGSSPVVVVRCAEHELALPLLAVESTQPARLRDIQVSRSQMTLAHQDTLLPLRDLGAMLGLREPEVPREGQPLLIVQARGQRVALSVDGLLGDRDLVIRALPPELRGLLPYQGTSMSARGDLVMVMRAEWLVSSERETRQKLTASRRALVVDDSLTARALHRAMLEAGGYTVHAVGSATQALEQVRHTPYDIVVCDIGMEEMDGFAFTSNLRAGTDTRELPVILVSARDTEADKQEGFAAGADGFLSKKECAAGRLLAEVATAIGRRSKERRS
ncbi:MAG: response regulator [Myxococcaceae bacterium]